MSISQIVVYGLSPLEGTGYHDAISPQSGDTSGWDQSAALEAINAFLASELPAPPTPCVTEAPLAAPLLLINRHAKAAEARLRELDDSGWEYAVAIYTLRGTVEKTFPQTSQQPNFVAFDQSAIPDGATMIAFLHNHPPAANQDGRLPSNYDRTVYDDLVGRAVMTNQRFNVDINMLFYIHDGNTNRTHVYDSATINSITAQCNLGQ